MSIKFSALHRLPSIIAFVIGFAVAAPVGWAQVRTKQPDRGVYRPPVLTGADHPVEDQPSQPPSRPAKPIAKPIANPAPNTSRPTPPPPKRTGKPLRELVEVALTEAIPAKEAERLRRQPRREPEPQSRTEPEPQLKLVGHEEVTLMQPQPRRVIHQQAVVPRTASLRTAPLRAAPLREAALADAPATEEGVIWYQEYEGSQWYGGSGVVHQAACDGCPECTGCDAVGCDAVGCDSMGACSGNCVDRWSNARLRMQPDRWFGSMELLLMFRSGDRLPILVTTSTNTDPDIAGELGQADTQVVAGGDTVLKDLTLGGRFTVGTWLDSRQCRSLVLRGWFTGEETFGFNANQNTLPVIARPFLNVSDNQNAAQDTQLVAFPGLSNGSIAVNASSDVAGADVQVRQFWYGGLGATVELLYGYQFMRLNEDLSISSTSTSLSTQFAPVGTILSLVDTFDAENEFHGGQFGIATRYRERCWSFDSTLKIGFGSLRRRAQLTGNTFTSLGGANAVDPNGLLVRSTNAGTITDDTFGWVPELDVSLGWHRYPRFDVTVGYHIIAMTDSLQVSGTIDPNLAANLSTPPTGQQNPAAALRYSTFYIQGIHFGLKYVY
ncbi:MAG: BBP7 family outer membrane beta-barrel protein [Pirellulales bacterium]|nr:BBP7 family outer membrane beta-barrel protein [Pirellulales bacterium]